MLVPVAIAGLTGHLPLAALVAAAFVITTATSYFDPAYGGLLPRLVDRRNVQQANGLVRATADALSVGGWALAGLLLDGAADQRILRAERSVVLRLGGDARRRSNAANQATRLSGHGSAKASQF